MCRTTSGLSASSNKHSFDGFSRGRSNKVKFLISTSDYELDADGRPSFLSSFITSMVIIGALFGTERLTRLVFENIQHLHPILEDEKARNILSRYIGVDALACAFVSILGYMDRHIIRDLWLQWRTYGFFGSPPKEKTDDSSKPNYIPVADFEKRLFTYHPASQRLLLIFMSYQIKDLYDSITWGDRIEFVAHHLMSISTAFKGMYPGCAHFYAIFFMGMSEISTTILCLLANFDAEVGVEGLADAFPTTKRVVGVFFVISFLVVRSMMWPYVSYNVGRDVVMALRSSSTISKERRGVCFLVLCTTTGLTFLQFMWLGQLFLGIKEEFNL